MRICLFTPTFFPVLGGAEFFCDVFARGMMARGHQVVVVAQKMKGAGALCALPYPVELYRRPPLQHLCAEILAWPLERAWRRHRFEIVVTVYGYPLAYAASRVKARLKFGLIAVAQGADLYADFNPKNKWRVNKLIGRGYAGADRVVGVSGAMAERARLFMGNPSAPVEIIHNGIDLVVWRSGVDAAERDGAPVAGEHALRTKGFTLQVGGLRQVKRPDLAIAAVAKCRDLYAAMDLKHVIIGAGKGAERYQALARELGVADRLVFAGFRDGRDKHWLYGNARLLVHASDDEGFPFVLPEAAASGLPVLVSDIQPHMEFLADSHCGFPFRHGDAADLAESLRRMLAQDLSAMQAAALERARDFDVYKMLDAYERLCREVSAPVQGSRE